MWAIVFVCVTALICFTAIAIVNQLIGRAHRGATNSEEARLVQEIHQGLTRLEKRIDALETIIIDHEHERERKTS